MERGRTCDCTCGGAMNLERRCLADPLHAWKQSLQKVTETWARFAPRPARCRRTCGEGSIAPREANERIEIRRGSGDAEVAAEIELGVFAEAVGESHVHLAL